MGPDPLKELLFVSILPTFDPNKIGHRYHFFYNMHQRLDELGILNYMVVPTSEREKVSIVLENRRKIFSNTLKFEDGIDFGKTPPRKLKIEIIRIMQELHQRHPRHTIVLHAYESSLSLTLAMLSLSHQVVSIVNLQDPMFWMKLFRENSFSLANLQRLFFRPELIEFTCVYAESKRMRVPMLNVIPKLKVYPTASAVLESSGHSAGIAKNQVLVFDGEPDVVLWIIEEVATTNIQEILLWRPKKETILYLEAKSSPAAKRKLKFFEGYPDFFEYLNAISSSRVSVIPYTDGRHRIQSSGKLLDCLIKGHFIVVPIDTALHDVCQDWGVDNFLALNFENRTHESLPLNNFIMKSSVCMEKRIHTHRNTKYFPDIDNLIKTFLQDIKVTPRPTLEISRAHNILFQNVAFFLIKRLMQTRRVLLFFIRRRRFLKITDHNSIS